MSIWMTKKRLERKKAAALAKYEAGTPHDGGVKKMHAEWARLDAEYENQGAELLKWGCRFVEKLVLLIIASLVVWLVDWLRNG